VYSATILDHFKRPRYAGTVADADLVGEAHNPLCGDRLRISIRLDGDRIGEARFRAEACAICTASASILMERVQGQLLSSAIQTDEAALIAALNGVIPAERTRCATLPLEALRGAIDQSPRISGSR